LQTNRRTATARITPAHGVNYASQVLTEYPVCNNCNRMPSTVADHITPVRLGGYFWDLNNLQGLCARCHNSKSAKEGI
jgi:5-methylcytosine-specific restriction endonuclease McrA